eukprot:TRINITY_DN34016_c0_g1_i1.p1 TRINITY_DN34016_c0_g1~~TRINITY_DN34016_c0_g1_i1.p1  ORF type:complete len:246 (-),score=52.75 TRINITY_DN34016_c0_g1_i1:37-774(-)
MGNSPCFQGVVPARPKGKMTLKYFPIAGRAEPIRLALMLGGFQYHDQRIPGSEWEEKHKKHTPYGQLPLLIVGSCQIAQTKAILRYVGKHVAIDRHALYPRDPLLAAKVDEILDLFDDLWAILAPTYRIADQAQKELARQRLFAPGAEAAAMMERFERHLAESHNGFVVPEAHLTIADLMYFCFLGSIRSGFVEGLGPDLLQEWPKIMKHKERIANIPQVKAYYQDSKLSNPSDVPFYKVFKPNE